MTYIISKESAYRGVKRKLYYLVKSYRKDGKIRREMIAGLGEASNVDGAIDNLRVRANQFIDGIHSSKAKIAYKEVGWGLTEPWRRIRVMKKQIKKDEDELSKIDSRIGKLKELKQIYKL